ncbi:Ribulokinase [compost metagenome]
MAFKVNSVKAAYLHVLSLTSGTKAAAVQTAIHIKKVKKTESARALLVNVANGTVKAIEEKSYKHGVITGKLPDSSIPLESVWALQDPNDYMEVLIHTIKECLQQANIDPSQVISLGVDFTACTVLPARLDCVAVNQTLEKQFMRGRL